MDRRTFAQQTAFTLFGAVALGIAQQPSANTQSVPATQQAPPKPPALAQDIVKEFVISAHGNLDKTKTMLAAEPGLINATWDWGGGDFEQAIGGAGHMGRKDIAEFLIANGARMDIFVAAMLGHLELVKAFLQAQPDQIHARGPHGIPLLAHAKMGAKNGVKEAEAVGSFLETYKVG